MSEISVPCPVCGAEESRVMYRPWRVVTDPVKLFGSASGERGTQTIVRCLAAGCGMMYASPRYSDDIIFEGYRSADDHGHDTQFESRVDTFLRALKKHAALLPPAGGLALDVGCAGGAFLKAAESFGYKATGVEPSEQLMRQARGRGLTCEMVPIEKFVTAKKFDLVTLWDVLEHVTKPAAVLRACRAILADGGALIVNIPDAGTLQAKLAGRHFWWFLSVHLSYFDRRTIRKLLEQEGFAVTSMRRHVQWLDVGYLLDVARIYSAPLASLLGRITPAFLKRRRVPYYASQTTVVARKRS